MPGEYSLYQNYPNPFNPVTHFEFWIANFGFASIKIYDVLGNEVKTLVKHDLHPGIYEIEWDASNYPSGIYFYTLSAGEFSETRKAVLIK